MTEPTPFERDMAEQPSALRRLAELPAPDLAPVAGRDWERIVLTGMGSSHFAGLPTWRTLTGLGLPAWTVDTGQLLDAPGLLTSRTLLVVTSQSGASGEAVELLDRLEAGELRTGFVLGVADDDASPVARQADLFVPLASGPESTVSTKSYLNTLAVHRRLVDAFTGAESARRDILTTADTVERLLASSDIETIGLAAAQHVDRRVTYLGWADEGATAQFAGLITKEASKVPAEGFVGGQFRHGPFELAGEGMTAVLFGASEQGRVPGLRRIAEDLVQTGSTVVLVGAAPVPGATTVATPGASALEALSIGSVIAQQLAVGLARGNGFVPGAFLHGSKVTTAL